MDKENNKIVKSNREEKSKIEANTSKGKNKLSNNITQNKDTKKVTISTIIFMILILFLAGCSLGKSITNVVLQSKAEVAKPVLEVKSDPKIDITAINNMGEYKFNVVNYKDNEISQVDLRYYIEIKADIDDSVKFELYKDSEEIKLENKCTQYMLLEKEKMKEDKYVLKIIYTKAENINTNSMKDIMEKVQIKVHSEQQKI